MNITLVGGLLLFCSPALPSFFTSFLSLSRSPPSSVPRSHHRRYRHTRTSRRHETRGLQRLQGHHRYVILQWEREGLVNMCENEMSFAVQLHKLSSPSHGLRHPLSHVPHHRRYRHTRTSRRHAGSELLRLHGHHRYVILRWEREGRQYV